MELIPGTERAKAFILRDDFRAPPLGIGNIVILISFPNPVV